ncbi:hypothetical protein C1H46_017726 [Malus baccata]|uniref:Uncharacterized protein n=1 Tax=Malus baccata TaxID=106549 RepID=A0A540MD46_MALBA|nr:hypothetical protein C1H46_017726 [Malus baccata]
MLRSKENDAFIENDASIALRNCKRIKKLEDPITPVKEILKLCPERLLVTLYKLPSFDSVDDFLHKVATVKIVISGFGAWTGEIHGRVDVCGDSVVGPEDHVLEGVKFTYNHPNGFPIIDGVTVGISGFTGLTGFIFYFFIMTVISVGLIAKTGFTVISGWAFVIRVFLDSHI